MATEQQFVTLGSGDLYIVSYSGTMPTEEAFETEEKFNEFCRSKSIENIFDWIKTSPAPKGATY